MNALRQTTDRARVRAALSHVPARDRETWVRMAMAVKAGLGEDGFDPWNEWSESDPSYNKRDARSTWDSIDPTGGVGIGTVFYEAERYGYIADRSSKPHAPSAEDIARREREAREHAERKAKERKDAAAKALTIWKAATPATTDHPYMVRKHVSPVDALREIAAGQAAAILGYAPKSSGEPLTGSLLVVPVKVGDELSTLELIDINGRKSALAGGAKAGGYWAAQPLPK